MRIAVAQLNPVVGDLAGNVRRIRQAYDQATRAAADLVVTPELSVTGYPPRDLLDRPSFVAEAIRAVRSLVADTHGPALLVGAVVGARGDPLRLDRGSANGALLAKGGEVVACHRKLLLPTYDVFDENRYFESGDTATVARLGGLRLGLSVCEDIWRNQGHPTAAWRGHHYDRDPIAEAAAQGVDLLINQSASPYDKEKPAVRHAVLTAVAKKHSLPLLSVNQIGGNDSLIFDGRSVGINADGRVVFMAPPYGESLSLVQTLASGLQGDIAAELDSWEADVVEALTLGLRDYLEKCGFSRAVIGLSGGIDSALTCALAARALGPEQVIGIAMPSRYSSESATQDALNLGKRLGVRVDTIPIEPMFHAFREALAEPFSGLAPDVTEENIQARIRGTLLMAYSNKLPATLLLATGNKSELAVGYCTLYGDMCGGLAPIGDLYKTEVYALCRFLNLSDAPPIPESTLAKPPSAELAPDQRDEDSLPPYDRLDAVLRGYIDRGLDRDALIQEGLEPSLVHEVLRLVVGAEYKRRQMPPGLRISRKAFGEGRRLPIAQRYRS